MVSSKKVMVPLNWARRQVDEEGTVNFSEIEEIIDLSLSLLWVKKVII